MASEQQPLTMLSRDHETGLRARSRSVWVRGFVALLVVIAFGAVGWLTFWFFADRLLMEFVAWPLLVGIVIAGWESAGAAFRHTGGRNLATHPSQAVFEREVERRLASLSALTHRVWPLGHPWPIVVVGPQGTFVVAPVLLEGTLRRAEEAVTLDGPVLAEGIAPLSLSQVRRIEQLLEHWRPPVVRDSRQARSQPQAVPKFRGDKHVG